MSNKPVSPAALFARMQWEKALASSSAVYRDIPRPGGITVTVAVLDGGLCRDTPA